MSAFVPTADLTAPRDTTGEERPPAPPGPVLMGDIHGMWGGQPMLLVLWAAWERERQ